MEKVKGLKCRECGREYPLAPLHVCEFCFGPLEVAYDYEAIAHARHARAHRAPARRRSGATRDLLPVDGRDRRRHLHAGFTPLVRARPPGARPRPRASSTSRTTPSEPDLVVQGPRRRRRHQQGARVRLRHRRPAPRPATWPTASPPTPPAPAWRPSSSSPTTSSRARSSAPPSTAPTLVAVDGNYDDVNRLCAEIGDKYQLGLRQHQPAALLRRRLARRSATRSPSSSAGARPTTASCRWPAARLSRKIYKGLNELRMARAHRRAATRMCGAQAAGCSPIVEACEPAELTLIKPVRSPTRSPSRSPSATPPTATTPARRSGDRAAGASTATDDEIVDGIKLLAETEGIFAETAGGVTLAAAQQADRAGP